MGGKYIVRCDIEGVSGVVSYEQAEPGKPEFDFGKTMFMADLMALIKGLNKGGAESIVIYDEHYYGRNIDLGTLPENVTVLCGKPPYRRDWAGGLDETFLGLILLGVHSKRGAKDALLNHTYENDIKNIILNGISVGEIGIEAAIAGDYDVPLVLVTGDSRGVAEAKALIQGVNGVVVKESISETCALCYPTAVTSKAIYEEAIKILHNPSNIKPYCIKGKVHIEIELDNGVFCDTFNKLYGKQIVNGTVVIDAASVTEAWAIYWEKKLECYKEMSRII